MFTCVIQLDIHSGFFRLLVTMKKISTHLAHSDKCYFHFFYSLSDWAEILWGFTKFFFKEMLKVSAFYFEKQKSSISKKIFFRPLSMSKQKSFVYWLNFQWRFWLYQWNFRPHATVISKFSETPSIHTTSWVNTFFYVLFLSVCFSDLKKCFVRAYLETN